MKTVTLGKNKLKPLLNKRNYNEVVIIIRNDLILRKYSIVADNNKNTLYSSLKTKFS